MGYFSKLERLKRQARSCYTSYFNALADLSCGTSLGENISSTALNNKVMFNDIMDEIYKLDPTAPKFKL